jgi:hypothetical protein
MCTSLLAPKPPAMPSAPAPVVEQDAPVFNPGSELDEGAMASTENKNKQGKQSLKTHDTGLAIPL